MNMSEAARVGVRLTKIMLNGKCGKTKGLPERNIDKGVAITWEIGDDLQTGFRNMLNDIKAINPHLKVLTNFENMPEFIISRGNSIIFSSEAGEKGENYEEKIHSLYTLKLKKNGSLMFTDECQYTHMEGSEFASGKNASTKIEITGDSVRVSRKFCKEGPNMDSSGPEIEDSFTSGSYWKCPHPLSGIRMEIRQASRATTGVFFYLLLSSFSELKDPDKDGRPVSIEEISQSERSVKHNINHTLTIGYQISKKKLDEARRQAFL